MSTLNDSLIKIILAPGQYKLERSGTVILGHSPKFSFGLKTQVEKQSDTPGKTHPKPCNNFLLNFLALSSITIIMDFQVKSCLPYHQLSYKSVT